MPEPAKPYILLVDDTAANLQVLGPLLRQEGWSVAAVTRGDDALELIAQRLPDLVLLDIMMPEMNGYEVCRRLRAVPATRDLPVLFITALADEEHLVRGFQEGGQDYLTKPFRPAELIARVRTHLALREAQQRLQRQANDLARLNADKDRFFSIIAHDLRSPLAGLMGLSAALAEHVDEFSAREAAEAAGEMAKSAQGLHQLLENLLEWAQLQTGRMECQPVWFDLAGVLAELKDLFESAARQKGIRLRLEGTATPTWGDRAMVQGVFRNLISNALKFTAAGGAVVMRAHRENGRAVGEVGDTGVGLTTEQQADLFRTGAKPGSRPGTDGERGTGLGLILCAELLQRNGGAIAVQSQPGRGSTFRVELPAPAGPA